MRDTWLGIALLVALALNVGSCFVGYQFGTWVQHAEDQIDLAEAQMQIDSMRYQLELAGIEANPYPPLRD